jgi:hypothetical protein
MPNTTWKSFERRLARDYGVERTQGMHGPDFVMDMSGTPLRAEVKKRTSTSGVATIVRWLAGRDLLFVGFKNQRDDDALVVMRKHTFDRLWAEACSRNPDNPDGPRIERNSLDTPQLAAVVRRLVFDEMNEGDA